MSRLSCIRFISALSLLFGLTFFSFQALAATTQVSTDTSWVASLEAPEKYTHIRDGYIENISPEDYLNRYRMKLGVPTFDTSEILRKSAQAHADYQAVNGSGIDPHGETPGLTGFTGEQPTNRCQAAGYDGYCTEVQAYGGGDLYSAIDALMMTPFHRTGMIYPYFKDIGCAQNGNWIVCNIGYDINEYGSEFSQETDHIIYPADGQVISTTFLATENPVPYPEYYGEFIGPTLMYWPLGISQPEAEVFLYDLTTGQAIDTIISIDTAISSANNAIFFNPITPLELDHEYAVRVRDISGADAFDESWTFKTQQSENIDFPDRDQVISYDAGVNWAGGAEDIMSAPNTRVGDLLREIRGHIMLAVDQHGEAWYIDPVTDMRYYLKDGEVAYEFLRSFGLGITNADLATIPKETDEVGGGALAEALAGRIVLQIEEHGEAYWIHPTELKAYYLADGDEAYRIMREKSHGTEIAWIEDVPVGVVE